MTLESVQTSRQFLGSISGSKVCQFLADVTAPAQILLALGGRDTGGSQVLDASGLQGGFQLNLGSVPTVNQGRAIFNLRLNGNCADVLDGDGRSSEDRKRCCRRIKGFAV